MSEENNSTTYTPPQKSSRVVLYLVIINVLVFAIQYLSLEFLQVDIGEWLALYNFKSEKFGIYQLVSHMFLHANFTHLFFNMFVLWMFGSALEQVWKPKKFLYYYFFCGMGAALLHLGINMYTNHQLSTDLANYKSNPGIDNFKALMDNEVGLENMRENQGNSWFNKISNFIDQWENNPSNQEYTDTSVQIAEMYNQLSIDRPTVGASGAIFGILLAFGMLFPNILIYVYFLFPIKAKYFVVIMGLIEIYMGLSTNYSNVANFAHVGGMLFGFILMKIWHEKPYYRIN